MSNTAEVLMPDGALKRQGDSLAPQGVVMHCSRAAAMTVNNSTDTVIGFDTKDFDPYGWLDTATGRFTPKIAGYYRMSANTLWTGMTSSSRWNAWFRKNGTVYTRVYDYTAGVTNDAGLSGTDLLYCNGTTDYVEFGVWQNSGAAKSIIGGSQYSFMSAELVGSSVGVVPEPWHKVGAAGEPAFQNGWVNYGDGRDAAFYKDPNGTVHLRGLIKSGTLASSAFTLPPGYRLISGGGNSNLNFAVISNSALGQVSVGDSGAVIPTTTGSNLWFDLSSIHFRAEQ